MKFFFLIILVITTFLACQNQDGEKNSLSTLKDTSSYTNIQWIDSLKDIGVVGAGKKTEIKFRFKNTGQKPLFIVSAEPGCGCTVADYPKEPIAPNSEGSITALYSASNGTTGEFRKNIHVTTNTKGSQSHSIYFYGRIRNDKDSITSKRIDTARLRKNMSYELNKNLLLKPIKN